MKSAPALVATRGLNTKVDPVRTVAGEDGNVWLSSCLNVDVDDTGRISRRKGFTSVQTGFWHSLFPCSSYMLGVTGDALSVITDDSSTPIRNVSEGARMRYASAWDGTKEVVFYMNGSQVGKVYDRVSHAVAVPEHVGPETSRTFTTAPIGTHVCVWNGRLWIATGKVLWHSEAFSMEAFDLARNFMLFDSDVRMIIPVLAGMMIGTGERIYFLRGSSPLDLSISFFANYGVIDGTEATYPGTLSFGNGMLQTPWFFGAKDGICVLTQTGEFFNITEKTVPYPEASFGSGGFIGDKYIMNLEG